MSECCGETRSTPYCPMCGSEVESEASALIQLRRHVVRNAKRYRGEADDLLRTYPNSSMTRTRDKAAKKWASWLEALDSVIAKEVTG